MYYTPAISFAPTAMLEFPGPVLGQGGLLVPRSGILARQKLSDYRRVGKVF